MRVTSCAQNRAFPVTTGAFTGNSTQAPRKLGLGLFPKARNANSQSTGAPQNGERQLHEVAVVTSRGALGHTAFTVYTTATIN